MSGGSTWRSSVKSEVTSDQTRKEKRAWCRYYRGKERAPRGFLGALVGTSMSIAGERGKEEEHGEKQTQG